MDTRKIPVICYWNGVIKDGPDGPFYEGGSVPRVIRVEGKIKLPKLMEDLHQVTGFEKGKFQIGLIGRYPRIVQQSTVKYTRLPVVDDSSVETMLEVPTLYPSITSVEFYLEVKTVSDVSSFGNNVSSLANQVTRKRCRLEDANVASASVRDNTREGNNNGWVENEQNTDARNCGNGGYNGDAEKGLNMKKPATTRGLSESVSKQLMLSGFWIDESELHVGMLFRDEEEMNNAVKVYSARRQRKYHAYESSAKFECKEDCGWILKAAETGETGFKVTKYKGPHTCKPGEVGSDFLASELEGLIRAQPSLSIAELIFWVKEEFGYTTSVENMWNAKKKAITSILGDSDKSFSVLPKFMATLCSTNKMVVDWQYDSSPDPKDASFRSVFWAFQQSIQGFAHLRPLIVVDTVELSSKYPGKMLVAAGFDAENRLFPLAFAIITQESLSADSWRWFFSCIRKKVTQREGVCLITSLSPDIVAAVNESECQWAQHRFCLRHLCLKFYDVFPSNLMTQFVYKAGSSRSISSFCYYLEKIEKMNPEARVWLNKIPWHLWVLAFDEGGIRFGIMETNTISSTYGVFTNRFGDFPITTFMLLIFDHLVELFKSRRGRFYESANREDKYVKHVMENLEQYKVASTTHDVLPLDKTAESFKVTEVMPGGENNFFVHLTDGGCTCGIWQVHKYPCSHVLAVCRRMNIDHMEFVNAFYSTESSLRAYVADFNPLSGVSDWLGASELPRLFPPGRCPASVVQPRLTKEQAWKRSCDTLQKTIYVDRVVLNLEDGSSSY